MSMDLSRVQTHLLQVRLDNGKTVEIKGRSAIGGNWGVTGVISFTAVAFAKDDAAIFLVNLRGKEAKLLRNIDAKTCSIVQQKFEETAMLTGMCYVLKLALRLDDESGIPQKQSNVEVAFRS